MNAIQNAPHVMENYSPSSSVLFSAFVHVLAWGTMIFRDRTLGQRIDGLEPRLAVVERENRIFIEAAAAAANNNNHNHNNNNHFEEETHIERYENGDIKCVKRSGSADEVQKVEKFNAKSYIRSAASSTYPRRSARLQGRGAV
ncbi:hypothetical protein ACEPPN_008026 [Leptodophora sp. 'Broadleaf-Isolate-01']